MPLNVLDGVERATYRGGLVVLRGERSLVVAVADGVPSGVEGGAGDLRVGVADGAVERHRHRHMVGRRGVEYPPEPDAEAVLEPGEVGHVRQALASRRLRAERASDVLVELVLLDVHHEHDGDACAARQVQRGPVGQGDEVGSGVRHGWPPAG